MFLKFTFVGVRIRCLCPFGCLMFVRRFHEIGHELHLQKVTKNEKGDERIENYRWQLPIPFRWQDIVATYGPTDTVVTIVINKAQEVGCTCKQVDALMHVGMMSCAYGCGYDGADSYVVVDAYR
jgi:hypothetical protein